MSRPKLFVKALVGVLSIVTYVGWVWIIGEAVEFLEVHNGIPWMVSIAMVPSIAVGISFFLLPKRAAVRVVGALSLILCVGLAAVYLRYTWPTDELPFIVAPFGASVVITGLCISQWFRKTGRV